MTSPPVSRETTWEEKRLGSIPPRLEGDLEALNTWVQNSTVALSEEQWTAICAYVHLLYHTSIKLNLVSVQERESIGTRHVWRALAMVPHIQSVPHETVIDVGSGSGIPAIPLKICLPETAFYLVESRRRRANFLKQAIRLLHLEKAVVINERVEDWKEPITADVVTARSVANPGELKALVQSHVRSSAWLFCPLDPRGESTVEGGERLVVQWKKEVMHLGRVPLIY